MKLETKVYRAIEMAIDEGYESEWSHELGARVIEILYHKYGIETHHDTPQRVWPEVMTSYFRGD